MVVTSMQLCTHTHTHTHLNPENMKTHLQNSFILETKDKTERKYHDLGVGGRGSEGLLLSQADFSTVKQNPAVW